MPLRFLSKCQPLMWTACAISVTACAATPRPQQAPVPVGFIAQTLPDTIVEGAFEGTATLSNGWMNVVVTRATLTFPPGVAERWRSLTVRAFVAIDYRSGRWKAPAESTPINMWQFIDFPRGAPSQNRTTVGVKDTLRFMVPVPPDASLATSRIGFQVEWVTLSKNYGQTESNFGFSAPLSTMVRPPNI
jgi:hypothetical protein